MIGDDRQRSIQLDESPLADAEGLFEDGPIAPRRAANPSRRSRLDFRIARQAELRDWMLARLEAGLPGVDVRHGANFLRGLISAWAAVGDNIAFYQEQIVQEGFLRTATEAFSVQALNRSLGYDPRPPVSARSHLAFTVLDARGGPDSVDIPQGLAVQSVPKPGQRPVVFETDAAIQARPEWNAMRLQVAPPEMAPLIAPGHTTQLHVADTRGLRLGMVLIVADPSRPEDAPQARILTEVEALGDGTAWIGWEEPLGPLANRSVSPQLLICTRSVRLFGAAAAPWDSASDAVKARTGARIGKIALTTPGRGWDLAHAGLPPGDLRSPVLAADEAIYAAVGDAVVRWKGESWEICGTPSPRTSVRTLIAGPHGRLFAGLDRGDVLVSADGGRVWSSLTVMLGHSPKGVSPRLPPSPVFSLAILESHGVVVAGGMAGVWTAPLGGGAWSAWNEGLTAGGGLRTAEIAVRALATSGRSEYFAATDAGLFRSPRPGARWTLVLAGDFNDLCRLDNGRLAAAGSDGVFLSNPEGEDWRAAPALPGRAADHVAGARQLLYASTSRGLFSLTEGESTWSPTNFDGQALPIVALAGVGARGLLAAQVFAGFAEADWPNLDPPSGGTRAIDLDRAYATPGSWVVFAPEAAEVRSRPGLTPSASQNLIVRRMASEGLVNRQDFGLTGRVIRLRVEDMPAVAARATWLHIGAEPLRAIRRRAVLSQRLQDGALISGSTAVRSTARLIGAGEDLQDRIVSLSGARPTVRPARCAGGVRLWDAALHDWRMAAAHGEDVRSLLSSKTHGLLVGTDSDVQMARTKAAFATSPPGMPILAMAERGAGILAATVGGITQASAGGTWTMVLPGASVQGLAVDAAAGAAAAADRGLFVSEADGEPWRLAAGWKAGARATAVAASADGWIVGDDTGRIFLQREGQWRPFQISPTAPYIHAIAVDGEAVHVATGAGLWSSPDGGARWRMVHPGDVRAVTASAGSLWSAVRGEGVRQDGVLLRSGLANDVRALLADGAGTIHAGARFGSALIRTGGLGSRELATPRRLGRIDDPRLAIWLKRAGPLPAEFIRLLATVGLIVPATATLSLGAEPQDGVCTIEETRDGPLQLTRMDDGSWIALRQSQLSLARLDQAGPRIRAHMLTPEGLEVALEAGPADLEFLGAAKDAEQVSEIVSVSAIMATSGQDATEIRFQTLPSNIYDAETVTVNANVVAASHGTTLAAAEVLGSGDNRVHSQTFALRGRPLSRLPAVDGDWTQTHHALEIRIRTAASGAALALATQSRPGDIRRDGQLWREVSDFKHSGPLDPHFVVRTDQSGVVTVTFGDGINGRRLPTGSHNVLALYRVGAGAEGNVEADALTQLRHRPPGLRRVTNPMPAAGGADVEDVTETRATAPLRARALSRIVSVRDFEAFALARPDLAKALIADRRAMGEGLILTVASKADGSRAAGDIAPTADHADLTRAMRAAAGRAAELTVAGARLVWFDLHAELQANSDLRLSRAEVLDAIQADLVRGFGFDSSALGAPVRAARLVAALQARPGVAAATLTALFRQGGAPDLSETLDAQAAVRGADGAVLGAELLLVGDITLRWRNTSPERATP